MRCKCGSCVSALLEEFRTFNIAEIAVFKVCLLSLGMLLGVFGRFALRPFRSILTGTFISTFAYLMFRLLIQPGLEKDPEPAKKALPF